MRRLTIIILVSISFNGFCQNLEISEFDSLKIYFEEEDLTKRNYYYEPYYINKITNELCEKFFDVKFNPCQSKCYSVDISYSIIYIRFIYELPCSAGGLCMRQKLVTLDYNGNLIDKFEYGYEFADASFTKTQNSLINENIIVSKFENKEIDYDTEEVTFHDISYKYFELNQNGKIEFKDYLFERKNRKYSFTSIRFVEKEELEKYDKNELSIMRNEIFADYGYKFKNQKWIDYFSNFDWFIPSREDVSERLNEIEKINVQTILEVENLK